MAKSVSILAIGSEILDGRIQDTNSAFIAAQLSEYGIPVSHILTCTDKLDEIRAALAWLDQTSGVIITTGGLGPTSDDLTTAAVAAHTNAELVLFADVLEDLKKLYQKRNRTLEHSNEKQAWLPSGASVLKNSKGSAVGFVVRMKSGKLVSSMPGVPSEMRAMFTDELLPMLLADFQGSSPIKKHMLRIFGLPEAAVGEKAESIALPDGVQISYRAAFPEIQVVLKSHGDQGGLDRAVCQVRELLGAEYIFSEDQNLSCEAAVHNLLLEKKATLALAESCTGGLAGSLITSNPGSSAYLLGGAISYSNKLKEDLLGVPAAQLRQYGAVSHEVAKLMAQGAKQKFGAGYAFSITGVAGPDGGSAEKPVGTFFVGLATPSDLYSRHFFFNSSRNRIRTYAAWCALDMLRRNLLGLRFKE